MKLTVIGCFGAYPELNEATSGYLIEEEDTKVLIDCGSGVLAKLQNYIKLSELDGVVLTHYHHDHCADLGCLQYASMIDKKLGRRTKKIVAWGPGEETRLTYKEFCEGHSYTDISSFKIGCLTFHVSQNVHDINCYAIKVTGARGFTIVYSGDTGFYPGLSQFAYETDCFLCESSFYEHQAEHSKEHLTSEEAAILAEIAKAKQLILTHLPHYGKLNQLSEEAAKYYNGKIHLAEQGMQINFNK